MELFYIISINIGTTF